MSCEFANYPLCMLTNHPCLIDEETAYEHCLRRQFVLDWHERAAKSPDLVRSPRRVTTEPQPPLF